MCLIPVNMDILESSDSSITQPPLIPLLRIYNNDMVNGTLLLTAGGVESDQNRSIVLSLESKRVRIRKHTNGLYGTWIPLNRARELARTCSLDSKLSVFLNDNLRDYFPLSDTLPPIPLLPLTNPLLDNLNKSMAVAALSSSLNTTTTSTPTSTAPATPASSGSATSTSTKASNTLSTGKSKEIPISMKTPPNPLQTALNLSTLLNSNRLLLNKGNILGTNPLLSNPTALSLLLKQFPFTPISLPTKLSLPSTTATTSTTSATATTTTSKKNGGSATASTTKAQTTKSADATTTAASTTSTTATTTTATATETSTTAATTTTDSTTTATTSTAKTATSVVTAASTLPLSTLAAATLTTTPAIATDFSALPLSLNFPSVAASAAATLSNSSAAAAAAAANAVNFQLAFENSVSQMGKSRKPSSISQLMKTSTGKIKKTKKIPVRITRKETTPMLNSTLASLTNEKFLQDKKPLDEIEEKTKEEKWSSNGKKIVYFFLLLFLIKKFIKLLIYYSIIG